MTVMYTIMYFILFYSILCFDKHYSVCNNLTHGSSYNYKPHVTYSDRVRLLGALVSKSR